MSRRSSVHNLESTISLMKLKIARSQKENDDYKATIDKNKMSSKDYVRLKLKERKEKDFLRRHVKIRYSFGLLTGVVMSIIFFLSIK